MEPIRVLFIGTGEFAVPVFAALLDDERVQIVGVVTQPDKPVGRDQKLEGGPLKKYIQTLRAARYHVLQPEKLRDESADILVSTTPDLIVVAAYGQMIPDDMLETPQYGALNLHGSLLPKLRGAVPVPMAILQGLSETGVTIQKMVKALDAGPIYAQVKEPILPNDTTESLKLRLAELGAKMLIELIPQIADGEAHAEPQSDKEATFCYERDIAKELAEITYETPADVAERMVRAYFPWPVAWIKYDQNGQEKRIKIYGAQLFTDSLQDITTNTPRLEIVRFEKRLLLILESGVLELTDVQLESKDRRPASEYLFLASRSIAATV